MVPEWLDWLELMGPLVKDYSHVWDLGVMYVAASTLRLSLEVLCCFPCWNLHGIPSVFHWLMGSKNYYSKRQKLFIFIITTEISYHNCAIEEAIADPPLVRMRHLQLTILGVLYQTQSVHVCEHIMRMCFYSLLSPLCLCLYPLCMLYDSETQISSSTKLSFLENKLQ